MPFKHKCHTHPCPVCRAVAEIEADRSKLYIPPPPTGRVSLPVRGRCKSLGDRTEFRQGCSGWNCEHGCNAGEPVAVPGGVCQTCNKWVDEAEEENEVVGVDIGPAPTLTPEHARIVCTVATGAAAGMLAATEPLLRRYAERCHADYLAITGPTLNAYALADKFRLHHLTPHYDRLLFVDADALVHPDAPDLFDVVPAGSIGIFDDGPHLGAPLGGELQRIAKSQGMTPVGSGKYFNSGVVLWNRDQAVWTPPMHALPPTHVAEQCWVQLNVERSGAPVHLLGREWNHQWWSDRSLSAADEAHILHIAGMSQSDTVSGWKMTPAAHRTVLLRAAAWAAQRRS